MKTTIIKLFVTILLSCCYLVTFAQVSGYITDQKGEPLPFAGVYVEGTTRGTVSNEEGYYHLPLEPGTYNLVYQYIGYQNNVQQVVIGDQVKEINIALTPNPYQLEDIVIAADAEDPAYAIMRKAIANRDNNQAKIKSYEADVYVKGVVKLLDAPESIMGQELGDMDGVLDSTRQGIVYLSESQSKIYFEAPDRVKEVMHSSIVSGSDEGINANQFVNARFDFYEEHQQFNRSLLSPLADNALSFYKFKLLGTIYDEDGHLINKIQVIPESKYKPLFSGDIYIHEKDWSIHSVDLAFTGNAIKQRFFDTIQIQQVFVDLPDEEAHPLYSQQMNFTGTFLGFTAGGTFTYIFSDYQLNVEHPKGTFNAELFSMTEDAVVSDSSFWEEARPIPLTLTEKKDYAKKDSLKRIWESKTFLDSVDRVDNKFGLSDLFFGYNFKNSYKNRYYTVSSPLTKVQYNAVEGLNLKMDLDARLYDSTENKQLRIQPYIQYGFADKQLKGKLSLRYRFDRKKRGYFLLDVGREYKQYNRAGSVSPTVNSIYTVIRKLNEFSMYDSRNISLSHFKEHWNGWYFQPRISYEHRLPLENRINHIRNTRLRPNNEIWNGKEYHGIIDMPEHKAILASMRVVWRPNQKYMSFPAWRARIPSGAPTFEMKYTKGMGDVDFDKILLSVSDNKVEANLWGHIAYNLEGGYVFNDNKLEFVDYFHFRGNETNIGFSSQYLNAFKRMPQYRYSTNSHFAALFLEHHFDGFILDRVPILRDIGVELILGTNMLFLKDNYYKEYNIGFENIGIGPFNLFRFDVVYRNGKYDQNEFGIKLGLSALFGG